MFWVQLFPGSQILAYQKNGLTAGAVMVVVMGEEDEAEEVALQPVLVS